MVGLKRGIVSSGAKSRISPEAVLSNRAFDAEITRVNVSEDLKKVLTQVNFLPEN